MPKKYNITLKTTNKAKLKLKGLQDIKIKMLTIFIKKYYHKTKKNNFLHVFFLL